jgi:ABC-type transport system substrate-binding protein
MKGWEAPGLVEYDYDLVAAVAAFEAGGFEDWDTDGVMEYSPGHDGFVVEELPNIQFYTRTDDDHRTYMAQLISLDMDLLGIPHDLLIVSYGTVAQKVWSQYDFDIYTEYWDWDPTPDFYAEWFMSRKDWYPAPWSDNQHRYHDKEFDIAAENFIEGAAPDVGYWCDEMQYIIHDNAVVVPVYSYAGYNARRTYYGSFPGEAKYQGELWEGMDCYPGEGWHTAYAVWTQMNAHPKSFEKGGTLRQGLNVNPDYLDPIDAIYFYEAAVIDLVYEGLTKTNPWDSSLQEPWLASSYTEGTWEHPTEGTCSAINYTLIPGVLFHDGEPMTADDVEFSFQFTKDTQSVGYLNVKDYEESVIYDDTPLPGVQTIEIRFNVQSWLAPLWAAGVYILPEHIWSDEYQRYCPAHGVMEYGPGVSGSSAWDPEDHDAVIGTGPFRFYKDNVVGRVDRVPMEYVYMQANPLYFREYVWPDVMDASEYPFPVAGHLDGEVTGLDFTWVTLPNHILTEENPDGTWPSPPGVWGEYCDVNKDGRIGVSDLLEIGVKYGQPWPPSYYEWSAGFPP